MPGTQYPVLSTQYPARTQCRALSTQYSACIRYLVHSTEYPVLGTRHTLSPRPAFTLFELILAIALSATLLALVGTAINLYLIRVENGRTRVEEAQLARSILAMIAADIRATSMKQEQDVSAVAQLAMQSTNIDVDDIDSSAPFQGSAIGSSSGAGGGNGSSQQSGGNSAAVEDTNSMAPGLNGTLNELYLDISRLPRLDALFTPAAAPSAAAAANAVAAPKPSDAKTIRYFVRQGTAIDPSDPAATLINPALQAGVGGLVRQSLDQAVRTAAEQTGNTAMLESGQALLAPEVTAIEFRYFDGTNALNEWNMRELEALPYAVEVRIWIATNDASATAAAPTTSGPAVPATRMYSQTVELPLASATSAPSATATDGSGTGASL